jgi:hypothetical protein
VIWKNVHHLTLDKDQDPDIDIDPDIDPDIDLDLDLDPDLDLDRGLETELDLLDNCDLINIFIILRILCDD